MRDTCGSRSSSLQLLGLVLVCLVILATMLSLSWWLARRSGFNREEGVIAIQFCGTKKSLATGLPMATASFAGSPVGLLVLPLMVSPPGPTDGLRVAGRPGARQVDDRTTRVRHTRMQGCTSIG